MRRTVFLHCLMMASVLAFASSSMWAQTSSKSASTQKAPAKTFRGRLPNNFGKIGLDAKQKESIYKIQATYAEQIDLLEMQLEELKDKQSEEILGVLTAEQKKALDGLTRPKSTTKATTPAEE